MLVHICFSYFVSVQWLRHLLHVYNFRNRTLTNCYRFQYRYTMRQEKILKGNIAILSMTNISFYSMIDPLNEKKLAGIQWEICIINFLENNTSPMFVLNIFNRCFNISAFIVAKNNI